MIASSSVQRYTSWMTACLRENQQWSTLELRVTKLEQGHSSHQDQLAEVPFHMEDLENWSRRNNLHLQGGLPEATGTENLSTRCW